MDSDGGTRMVLPDPASAGTLASEDNEAMGASWGNSETEDSPRTLAAWLAEISIALASGGGRGDSIPWSYSGSDGGAMIPEQT